MKVHRCEQGQGEWFALHLGRVTASEFGNLMTDGMEPRKWSTEMPQNYLAEKVSEVITDCAAPGFSSWQTDQGHFRETIAIPWYELEYEVELQRVGFLEHDDGRCGCSPDAIISGAPATGMEIKCAEARTHTRWLIDGALPKQHSPQVHFSLYVSGYDHWRFLSYRSKMPALLVEVERDEKIMAAIGETLAEFYKRFEAALAKIRAMQNH